jgi:phosphate starvation-inducible protein PhoH and related proteins
VTAPRHAAGRAAPPDRAAAPEAPTREGRRVTETFTLEPVDNRALANLCGPLDANLRQIEAALDVTIARRGASFSVTGARRQAELGARALQRFYGEAEKPLSVEDIQLGLVEIAHSSPHADPLAASGEREHPRREFPTSGKSEAARQRLRGHAAIPLPEAELARDADHLADEAPYVVAGAPILRTRRADLHGRTPNQVAYLDAIRTHDICFGIGPAGTGKTYLAVACAVDALERDAVKRIVLVRPAVEAGERLGFLPGDLAQKVDPYLRPLFDALYDLMGFDKAARLLERQTIELAPLAYMRGRTLNHSFIILDEAQNTTPEQMKMFLTRIGFGTKAVITGDVTQIDLARGQKSGLIEAERVLKGVRGIAFVRFTSADVVRHPLVQKIIDAYDRDASD